MLSCYCDDYGDESYNWVEPQDYTTLQTKRRKRCISCKELIDVGAICLCLERERAPYTEIEAQIMDCDSWEKVIPMAPWYMCERCSDLYWSLRELGFCIGLPDNMLNLVKEYSEMNK